MKTLVVLVATVALCAGSAIPIIPGDNSHYVEGESRYIWMPDGDGVPHLVDLQEPVDEEVLNARNGANNQYWLFTRQNPTTRQIITHNNVDSINNSNYDSSRALMVIVHGWNNNGGSPVNTRITAEYLRNVNANVIVVDWNGLAGSSYNTAVAGVPGVGQSLGNFLTWLINNGGGNWNTVHLVGHSLGAHVVGNAGRTVFGRPTRVTGLDPAGPNWRDNSNALNRNNGQYVEVIHTDGGALGIHTASGDVDFYPNAGNHPQPGCFLSTCSHSRAWELFAATARYNNLTGRRCNNMIEAVNNWCRGDNLLMGNTITGKRGTAGIYGLTTGANFPF